MTAILYRANRRERYTSLRRVWAYVRNHAGGIIFLTTFSCLLVVGGCMTGGM